MTRARLAIASAVLAMVIAGISGCGSAPVAAPVLDRSVNPRTPAPVSTAPAARAPATQTPAASSAVPATSKSPAPPASAPAETAAVVKPVPAAEPVIVQQIEEPPAKPYREGDWRPEFHVVRKGDTLYSIALDYGRDYRELAAWNRLDDPALIRIDQRLRLFPPEGEAAAEAPAVATATAIPMKTGPKARKLPYSDQALAQLNMASATAAPAPTTVAAAPATSKTPAVLPPARMTPAPKPADKPAPAATAAAVRPSAADDKLTWEWPARGKLNYRFGEGSNQKGIAIDGKVGDAVLASAPGKVVYSGSGLRGYGKLVIIKHNASYLSVYAHNSQILVKEGQAVAKGQKIAEMGDTDSSRVGLHFEIRRLGKPVDPMQYLPQRAS